MLDLPYVSRRLFLKSTGIGMAGLAVASPVLAASYPPPSPLDIGQTGKNKISFKEISGEAEVPKPALKNPLPMAERTGFAVVALGRLSLEEILPAFAESKMGKLFALVSGTPEKAKAAAAQYGVKPDNLYSYEDFDSIKGNKDIDAVYIVLPNAMHREFVERAAKAGKHVLCEKPMATNAEDAKAMVDACRAANVKLMIAYRCQYEPYNREMIRMVRSGELGRPRFIEASNSQSQGDPSQWRLKKVMAGGGALPDIGLYCLNGARAILGEEPDEVFAYMSSPNDDPRFKEIEERMSFMLRFPSGTIANCATSYDAFNSKDMAVRLEKGWIKLDGAYSYRGKQMRVSNREGQKAIVKDLKISEKNQFALEIDHFADCIKHDIVPRTPGEEGLQDHIIMDALYRSAQSGQPVKLDASDRIDSTRGPELKDDKA